MADVIKLQDSDANPKKGYRPVWRARRVKRGRWAGPFESDIFPSKEAAEKAWKKEIKPEFKKETGYIFFKIKYVRVGIKKPKVKPKKKKAKKPVKEPKAKAKAKKKVKKAKKRVKPVVKKPEKIPKHEKGETLVEYLERIEGRDNPKWKRSKIKEILKKYAPEKITVDGLTKLSEKSGWRRKSVKKIAKKMGIRVIKKKIKKSKAKAEKEVAVATKGSPKRIYIGGIKGGHNCPPHPDAGIAKDWKTMRGWMDLTGLKPPKEALEFYKGHGIKSATVSVKADGELMVLHWSDKGVMFEGLMEPPRLGKYFKKKRPAILVNSHHTIRIDNYITDAFAELMKKKGMKNIRLVGELYAVYKDGKPMSFGDMASSLDSDDWKRSKNEWVFWAFDIQMIDGKKLFNTKTYAQRVKMIRKLLSDGPKNIIPIPAEFGPPVPAIKKMWRDWVLKRHYEGLVITEQKGDFFRVAKCKTQFTVDAVIIGFDHSGALYKSKGIPNAFLLALMDRKGRLIELGKMSGGHDGSLSEDIKLQWKKRLIKDKFAKDDRWVFVKPRYVVEVKFLETSISRFKSPKEVRIFKIKGNKFSEVGKRPGYVPRSGMKFVRRRKDKDADKQDIRLSQVAEYVGETMRGRALKKLAKTNPMLGWRKIVTENNLGE